MKKIIAILLCFMLLPLNFTVPVSASEDAETKLVRVITDYFTGTEGSNASGWTYVKKNTDNVSYVYAADPSGADNSVLKLDRTAKETLKLRRDLGNIGNGTYFWGDMTATFRFYDETGTNNLWFRLRQYNPTSEDDTEGGALFTVTISDDACSCETGKWYDVRVEIDDAGTWSAYLTDGNETVWESTGNEFNSDITGFWQLDFESQTSSNAGTMYIDDFFLYINESTELENKTGLKELFSDDFSGIIGEKRNGWTAESDSTVSYLCAQDPQNPDETVLKLSRSAESSSTKKMYKYISGGEEEVITDDLLITFRAYDEDGTGRFNVVLRPPDADGEGPAIFTADLVKACTPGVWYDCFIEVKNNGTDEGYWNMWMINDEEKITIAKNKSVSLVNGICRFDFLANRSKIGDWYVDDLKIYTDYRNVLASAAEALTFDMISNEQLIDDVHDNLTPITEVEYSDVLYPVIWESADKNLIGDDGSVYRKPFTHNAIFTAKICLPGDSSVYIEKDFDITIVKSDNEYTDEEVLWQYAEIYLKEELFTDEKPNAVTKNLKALPTVGAEGMTFGEWVSSDSAIISTDGTVSRPEYGDGDTEVTLSNTLTMNETSIDVTLTYTVQEKPDPYIDINATLEKLTYSSLTNEDNEAITKNLTLNTKGEGYATISWLAKPEGIISETGVVTRGDTKETVTLTATVSNAAASESKEFTFIVLPTREKMLEADMAELNLEGTPALSESFDLPLVGETYNTQFTWESTGEYLKINEGRAVVYRPSFETGNVETNIILTATLEGEETSFTFPVTILCEATDTQIVEAVVTKLDFSQISLETEESVTQNLALITQVDGVDISWNAEGYEEFVSEKGEIFRPIPGEDAEEVTITATFTRGAIVRSRAYTFTIIPFENSSEVLERAKEALIFSLLSSEDIKAVTQNLTLPSVGKYGTDILWTCESSNLKVEGETGIVTRPNWGKTNALVQLVATISYEGLTDTRTFNIEILEKNYMEVEQDVWSEDFESWTADNMYNTTNAKWTHPAETEAVLSLAVDPTDENNNVLKIDRTGTSGTGYVIASAKNALNGIVYMGLRVFVPEDGQVRINGRTADCDQVPVTVKSSGVTATGYSLVGPEVNINGWNKLDLIIDVNNERYQVMLNDVLCEIEESDGTQEEESGIADGIPFNYYGQGRNKTIQSFRMTFSNNKVSYIDDLYMENKVLYTDIQLNLAEAWEKEFLSKNDINALKQTLVFPSVWADKVRVFYYTSDSNILDTAGMIQLASGEADVVFKVGFNDEFTEYFKSYLIHVIKTETVELSDQEAADADLLAALNVIKGSGILSNLKNNISIPSTTGESGSTITVTSSDTSVLSNSGVITQTSSPQTVTLTVTAVKNGSKAEETLSITVAKKTEKVTTGTTSSGSGGNGGGIKVNYGDPTKSNSGIEVTQPDEENKAIFSDLSDKHWAYSELMYMVDNKIMNGTGDGNIQPERTILREEFIKMLVLAMGVELTEEEVQFSDVTANAWYAPYIATAKKIGLVNGYSDGRVGTGENITREDMAVMIFRATELAQSEADDLFGDDEAISSYAKTAVYTLRDMGVINGKDNGNFAPTATATRAETACMLYRAINKDLFN